MSAKEKHENHANYLFVSDFHMSLGKDTRKKSINMREDFFFDEEFFRFLRWADENRVGKENGKDGDPWELVFMGDCFDFLPVDKYVSLIINLNKKVLPGLHTKDLKEKKKYLREFFKTNLPVALQEKLIEPYFRSGIITEEDLDDKELKVEVKDIQGIIEFCRKVRSEEIRKETFGKRFMNQVQSVGVLQPINRLMSRAQQQVKQGWDATLEQVEPIKQIQQQFEIGGVRAQRQLEGVLGREKHDLFSEEYAVIKLEIISAGHPKFFEALAWWVARGNKIVVMVGNHDLELRWPEVQAEFKNILVDIQKEVEWTDAVIKSNIYEKTIEKFVDFKYFWFYYIPGLFYAQHGSQYDKATSTVNLINPFWEKNGKKLLYASFGSYGDGLVSEMEDYFPEWDNAKTHGPTLINKIKNYPYRVPKILLKNIATQVWFILRLFFGTRKIRKPKDSELLQYLIDTGLWSDNSGFKFPLDLAREIYESWDTPLLHQQWWSWLIYILLPFILLLIVPLWLLLALIMFVVLPVIRFIFSLKGFLITVLVLLTLFPQYIGGLVLSIVDLIKVIGNWIKDLGSPSKMLELIEDIKPIVKLAGIVGVFFIILKVSLDIKKKIYTTHTSKTKKLFQLFTWGEEKYIQEAGREVYQLFKLSVKKKKKLVEDKLPRYFIFGHDHFPFSYVLNENDRLKNMDDIFYFNTGAWQSWFAREGHRRLRTGGSDLEFTFLRIMKPEGAEEYEADLLRWNDDANTAVGQIVFERKEETSVLTKILHGWIFRWTVLVAGVGFLIGFLIEPWGLWFLAGAIFGALIGFGFELWAKDKPQY